MFGDAAAGAPGHRDAVAGGGVGIGGVQVDLAGAAGGQHRVLGLEGQHLAGLDVLHVQAEAARWTIFGPSLSEVMTSIAQWCFEQRDVRMRAHLLFQRHLHRVAGGVGGVDDAALAVAAFAGQVEAQFGAGVAGERHALLDQPFDRFAAVFDDEAGGAFVAQAGAGDQGVGDVLVVAVAGVEHGGDAALGPVAGAVEQRAFGNDGNLAGLRPGAGRPTGRPGRCRRWRRQIS